MEAVQEPAEIPRARGLSARLLDFDEWAEGRRLKLVLAIALCQSVLAPVLDRAVSAVRDIQGLSGVARQLGSVSFAGFQAISLLSALVALTLGLCLVGGRVATFLTEPAISGVWSALGEVRLLLATEWRLLRRRGGVERFLVAGLSVYVAAITLRDTMRLARFCAWEGPIVLLGLEDTFLASPLLWMYRAENALEVAALGSAVVALFGLAVWVLHRPPPAQLSAPANLRAVSALPVGVDVQSAVARSELGAAFHGDLVKRALEALSNWSASEEIGRERELQLRLFEHLESAGFQVGWEVQLGGRSRVDLTIDDAVAVELKFGALRANERNRAVGQSTDYALKWSGRGPLLVVCVGAPEERVRGLVQNAENWNRRLTEHRGEPQELPAPIFVLTRVGEPGGSGTQPS